MERGFLPCPLLWEWAACSAVSMLEQQGVDAAVEQQEGRALQPPTHSSKRKAGQGHVHEAIVPAEAPAAGPRQDLFNHLGEKEELVKHLVVPCFRKGLRSKIGPMDQTHKLHPRDMFSVCMCVALAGACDINPRRSHETWCHLGKAEWHMR